MPKAAVARAPVQGAAFRRIPGGTAGGPHSYLGLLGLKSYQTPELVERVKAGFAFKAFERLRQGLGLSTDELADLVRVSRRTLARRQKEGRLSSEESDRLLRVARVFAAALALFGGDAGAVRGWFATRAPALGGRTPLEVATTEIGAREVEHLIGRLEYGVLS